MRGIVAALCRSVLICSGVVVLMSAPRRSFADSPRPDLVGTVKDELAHPVGNARVFIYTAGPKEGAGILCPSCYADCRKRAITDADGHFKIEALDPALIFRILVVAQGSRPQFVTNIDPVLKPIEVTLHPAASGLKPDEQAKGRVLDAAGKPISGAVVSIRGVTRGQSTQFGGNDDLDQVAVTDDDGRFVINGDAKFDAVGVDVEARGFAKGVFAALTTGGAVHDLKLTEGASVKGRLVQDGKPLAGIEMDISGANREASAYAGDFTVGTDNDGRFLFVNLPPRRDYILLATMKSAGSKGVVRARHVQAGDDGSLEDAGDVPMVPGFKLEGVIRLSDGKPVPAKTRVLVSRDEGWDATQIMADPGGHFSFAGLPPDPLSLSARVRGYRLSSRNRSLDTMNAFSLVGSLKRDKTDLVVELEPGEIQRPERGEYVDIRQEPLRGSEGLTNHEGEIHITGKVVDSDTGAPVAAFYIDEGRFGTPGLPNSVQWLESRRKSGTNGQFDIYVTGDNVGMARSAPLVMVEAQGYLPKSSGEILTAETNFTFALKKGTGPSGTVLSPTGSPEKQVKVYLANMRDGVYVSEADMSVREGLFRGTRSTDTDDKGNFSFSPRMDDYAILVLVNDGFAQVTIPELQLNSKVTLQPWGKVNGRLMIGSRPGTNESIHLGLAWLPFEYHPRDFAPLSLFLETTSDADGNFSFERVPPVNIQVYYSPNVRNGRTGVIPVSQPVSFALKPGEVKTIALGGKGRPVIGRLDVSNYDGTIDWRADVQTLELILPPEEQDPDLSAILRYWGAKLQAAGSDEEKKAVMAERQKAIDASQAKRRAFYATDEGKEYQFRHRSYVLNFAQDGSFRVEDVPGGKYRLHVELHEGDEGPMRMSSPAIASLDKEFDVPDSPSGRSEEPFDLGKIELQHRRVLRAGKPAPDFEVRTVDGRTAKLSDFAGKYVLLDFWAVWCGPCVAETPYLKAAYDAFKDDPRFGMIGLSLDPKIEAPRDYMSTNHMAWTGGFLGEWSKTDLPDQYGVVGIPSIFLIGPDGKIIAKDLRGEAIKGAVRNALRTAGSQ